MVSRDWVLPEAHESVSPGMGLNMGQRVGVAELGVSGEQESGVVMRGCRQERRRGCWRKDVSSWTEETSIGDNVI